MSGGAPDGPALLVDEQAGRLGTRRKLPAWLEPERDGISGVLAPL